MTSIALTIFKSRDADQSYAIALEDDPPETWRARSGFGQEFERIWAVDLQSETSPEVQTVDWETVLERAIEAYHLSDPVITNFEWPNGAAK